MSETLAQRRRRFFARVTEGLAASNVHLLLITHCLSDRPEFVDGLARLVASVRIVAIPYSIHEPTVNTLRERFEVSTPSLDELRNSEFLLGILEALPSDAPIVVSEIGGYFAPLMSNIPAALRGRIKGVIEDTEAGHRRYLAATAELKCGVISVARSPLKEPEDSLVGASCVFSVERVVRDLGTVLDAQHCLVLGYGKVGRGLANHLRDRRLPVSVFDTDPIRRLCALSEGFLVPDRAASLSGADIIFGATGNHSLGGDDVRSIRDGTLLVSCSSKTQEFDLTSLRATARSTTQATGFERLEYESKVLYLASAGYPVNFRDGAVIGPVLSLVQAEIMAAVALVSEQEIPPGVHGVPDQVRRTIAEAWLSEFTHVERGSYKRSL